MSYYGNFSPVFDVFDLEDNDFSLGEDSSRCESVTMWRGERHTRRCALRRGHDVEMDCVFED